MVIVMIFDCIDLVNRKYYNILDKQGTPFINHSANVMRSFTNPTLQCIGILHGILEDTNCTEEEILKITNKEILNNVIALTKTIKIMNEQYFIYIESLEKYPLACLVKVSDILDNYSISRQYESNKEIKELHKIALEMLFEYINKHKDYYIKNNYKEDYEHIIYLLDCFWDWRIYL